MTADHFAVLHDLFHHVAHHVDGNREANTLVSASASRDDCRVDPNQVAVEIQERAAGIPRVDGCICLNEIFIVLNRAAKPPPCGADNSHGRRFSDAEGISDGKHHISDLQFGGIS